MANPTGFLQYPRIEVDHRPISDRIQDQRESTSPDRLRAQPTGRPLHGLRRSFVTLGFR